MSCWLRAPEWKSQACLSYSVLLCILFCFYSGSSHLYTLTFVISNCPYCMHSLSPSCLFCLQQMNDLTTLPTHCPHCIQPLSPSCTSVPSPTEDWSHHTLHTKTHCPHCMLSPSPICLSVPSPAEEWSHHPRSIPTTPNCLQTPSPSCTYVPSPTEERSLCCCCCCCFCCCCCVA